MSASQPSRFAPSTSQPTPSNEVVFEPLLDSEEAAELLRIHPKRYSEWPATGDSRYPSRKVVAISGFGS